jgi:WD40 repeat protein
LLVADTTTGQQRTLPGQANTWASVQFTPDGRLLRHDNTDGRLEAFDVPPAALIGSWTYKAQPAGTENFSDSLAHDVTTDGRLVVGRLDNTVAAWNVSLPAWISQLCGLAGGDLTSEQARRYLGDPKTIGTGRPSPCRPSAH